MRSPLVVIGAQKSGTATLTQDLLCCEHLWVEPSLKEESPLIGAGSGKKQENKIRAWFQQAGDNRIPVNISTQYSMTPEYTPDIELLAKLYPRCRIIYVLRDRLDRSLSHHHHDQVLGITRKSAEKAIHEHSPYVWNSLYGKQLQNWLAYFPEQQIMLIKFEDYVSNRPATLEAICDFLEVPSDGVSNVDQNTAHNVTANRHKFNPLLSKVLRSAIYKNTIKKVLGASIRNRLKSPLSGKNNVVRSEISPTLTGELIAMFERDQILLRKLHKNTPDW